MSPTKMENKMTRQANIQTAINSIRMITCNRRNGEPYHIYSVIREMIFKLRLKNKKGGVVI
jgi:hypothetical protein